MFKKEVANTSSGVHAENTCRVRVHPHPASDREVWGQWAPRFLPLLPHGPEIKHPSGLGEMPRPQRRPHLEVEAQGSTERLGTLRDWSHGGEGDPRRQRGDTGTDSGGVPARLPVEAEGHSLPGPPAVRTRGASGSGPGAARGCEAGPCLEARGVCAL